MFNLIFAMLAGSLAAQTVSDIANVDEMGHGTFASDEFTPTFYCEGAMYSYIAADPSGGITNSPVLIYDLDAVTINGDVAIVEPGFSVITKLLRFYTTNNETFLIYYSQPDGTPAGVGIPPTSSLITIIQTNNTVTWNPFGYTQPGFSAVIAHPAGFSGYGYCFQTENHTEQVSMSGTNLSWKYTSAFSACPIYVRACTNLSLPMANWTYVSTNMTDQFGGCVLKLPVTQPALFYRVEVPSVPVF